MSDYQAVRRLVYERDKGRCVVCLEAARRSELAAEAVGQS